MDKIIRSVLYVPGVNEKAIQKARQLPCDAIIFDLEDAVAPDRKAEARRVICESLCRYDYGDRLLIVRINRLNTAWGEDDLKSLVDTNIDAICLPKVESSGEVVHANLQVIKHFDSQLPLWVMIETCQGLASSIEIASSVGVNAMVLGTTDLSYRLGLPSSSGSQRPGLHYSLSKCVFAARLAGIHAFDGVYLDISDSTGLRKHCLEAKSFGYDGKTLIHPSQVEITNEIFGPSSHEVERSRRIISAWEEAQIKGEAVAVVDGELIELMHVEKAKRLLALQL